MKFTVEQANRASLRLAMPRDNLRDQFHKAPRASAIAQVADRHSIHSNLHSTLDQESLAAVGSNKRSSMASMGAERPTFARRD